MIPRKVLILLLLILGNEVLVSLDEGSDVQDDLQEIEGCKKSEPNAPEDEEQLQRSGCCPHFPSLIGLIPCETTSSSPSSSVR
jgi:hypothetical protein